MASKNNYYYYAEKNIGDYTVEVNGGKYKVHFDIEIVNNKYRNVIAKGAYKNLNDLNVDLEKWIKANLINATQRSGGMSRPPCRLLNLLTNFHSGLLIPLVVQRFYYG